MAKYLFVDIENNDITQVNSITNEDRELAVNESLQIFRFENGKFEQLTVDEITTDDDGNELDQVEYDDSWTAV